MGDWVTWRLGEGARFGVRGARFGVRGARERVGEGANCESHISRGTVKYFVFLTRGTDPSQSVLVLGS